MSIDTLLLILISHVRGCIRSGPVGCKTKPVACQLACARACCARDPTGQTDVGKDLRGGRQVFRPPQTWHGRGVEGRDCSGRRQRTDLGLGPAGDLRAVGQRRLAGLRRAGIRSSSWPGPTGCSRAAASSAAPSANRRKMRWTTPIGRATIIARKAAAFNGRSSRVRDRGQRIRRGRNCHGLQSVTPHADQERGRLRVPRRRLHARNRQGAGRCHPHRASHAAHRLSRAARRIRRHGREARRRGDQCRAAAFWAAGSIW